MFEMKFVVLPSVFATENLSLAEQRVVRVMCVPTLKGKHVQFGSSCRITPHYVACAR